MVNLQSTMQVRVNGEIRELPDTATVAELVAALGSAGKRVAVERNGEIVPRSRHAVTRLTNGDHIEVVVAVGGG